MVRETDTKTNNPNRLTDLLYISNIGGATAYLNVWNSCMKCVIYWMFSVAVDL